MSFIARMLKYLFWVLVVSWSVALLQRLVGKMATGHTEENHDMGTPNNAVNQKLVRDPVCGMHVAEGLALPFKASGETVYFCSAQCREKYMNGTMKISASA